VPAATLPRAAAHHGFRLLLQHRSYRRRRGTVFFGIFVKVDEAVGDFRNALLYAGFMFLPSAAFALMLPSEPEQADGTASAVE
jgi:hypothetical protein